MSVTRFALSLVWFPLCLAAQQIDVESVVIYYPATGMVTAAAGVDLPYDSGLTYDACANVGLWEERSGAWVRREGAVRCNYDSEPIDGWDIWIETPQVTAAPDTRYVGVGIYDIVIREPVEPPLPGNPSPCESILPGLSTCYNDFFGFSRNPVLNGTTGVTDRPTWSVLQYAPVYMMQRTIPVTSTYANGRTPKPTLSLSANGVSLWAGGQQLNPAGFIEIDAAGNPYMPVLSASLANASPAWTVAWTLDIRYERLDSTCPGNSPWRDPTIIVNAVRSVATPMNLDSMLPVGTLQGGDATVRWTINGVMDSATFRILGRNPSAQQVEAWVNAKGLPWFAIKIFRHESGLKQFNDGSVRNGEPNWGIPCGFGIGQIDPPSSAATLWNWKANVTEAGNKLRAFNLDAAWRAYVRDFGDAVPNGAKPPCPAVEGGVTFQYAAEPGPYVFSAANWITAYNRGSGGDKYILWFTDRKYWLTKRCKYNSYVQRLICYVEEVCQQ